MSDNDTAAAPPPEDMRTTPLAWDELAPFSIAGTIELAGDVLEGAEQAYIAHTEPHYHTEWVGWGVLALVSDEQAAEVIRYAIERRPAPEVLFNKMRELGHITGPWEELTPVDRASFELAARILPAVADVAEVMNAEMVRRNPPPATATAAQLVDIEDTILERVDGIDDIDPQMAAAREKADEEAAKREAAKKPAKAKKATQASV